MHTSASFDYAVLRVVPRVERGEFINVGVILLCREKRFLGARVHVDEQRLQALWPAIDLEAIRQHIDAVTRICTGDESAGPIAKLSQSERFHWLTSPAQYGHADLTRPHRPLHRNRIPPRPSLHPASRLSSY